MLAAGLEVFGKRPLRILCLGAHCDDIEIGCGGTLLQWQGDGRPLEVDWVVFSSTPERELEGRESARAFLEGARRSSIEVCRYRDGYFPDQWAQIKGEFERLKGDIEPDLIFTHHHADLHQDHSAVSALTWNTFRHHLILEYEIPKYDADLGNPNVLVAIGPEVAARKARSLVQAFPSQRAKAWFTEDTFLSIMRLRGVQLGDARYAEGFHGRKIRLG